LDPVVLDHDDVPHLPGPFLGQGDVDLGDLAVDDCVTPHEVKCHGLARS
jgi:hypothetical protein